MDREFKGIWIPREIWVDKELNALEKIILVEIDSLDNGAEHCYASNEYIAGFCQCSAWKVSQAISKLARKGYISVMSFDGRRRTIKSNLSTFSEPQTAAFGNPQDGLRKNQRQTLEPPTAAFGNPNTSNIVNNKANNQGSSKDGGGGFSNVDNPFGEAATTAAPTLDPLVAYAQNNLMHLGPYNMDELISFRDALPDEVIQHAIDEACAAGVRRYKYVKSILNRYVEQGFKSVAEVEAQEEQRMKDNRRRHDATSGEYAAPEDVFG